MIYLGCAALLLLYLALYVMFGRLFFALCGRLHLGTDAALGTEQLLAGYFFYHLCFYVVCIPLKLCRASLGFLTLLWLLLLVAAVVCTLWLYRRGRLQGAKRLSLPGRYVLLYGVLLFLLVSLMNVNMQTGALWDESHYVGEVTTSLYTDSLSGYDVYTGRKTKSIDEEYLLEITETHSAVMCRIFPIPPSVEVRTVRATANLLLFYLLIFLLGQRLLAEHGGEDGQKKAALFFCIFVGLDLFSYNLHTRAQILLYRAFEGKAILANIILFSILYVFLLIYRDGENKRNWAWLFLVVAASFGLNMTSLLLVPALVFALMLPYLLPKKRRRYVGRAVVCLLPWLPELVFYLVMHG